MYLKKILIFPFYGLFCIIFFSFAECTQPDEGKKDIIAVIGDKYEYTFNDLRKYVFDWGYNKKYRDAKEGYKAALDAMITNQLKKIDFFARGLNKDEEVIQNIRRIIKEEIVVEYFHSQYVGKYTNDEYAKNIYGIADKQVNYQRILLILPQNATENQKESLKKKALDIQQEIINGKEFRQFVKQYSQDSLSINSNGFVPPVGWEQSLTDPIGKIVFNLKPGDVRVLNSLEGFYIIKVAEVIKIDVQPFEQIKNEIISKLKNIYFEKSLAEFQNDKEKLVDENSFKWNNGALKKLAEWSEIPGFYNRLYQDTLQKAISKNNFTISTYSNGQVDVKEYLRLLNNVLIPRFSEIVKEDDIKAYIIESLRTDNVIEKAEKLGIETKLFNVKTDNPILKNQIVILYNQAVIDSQNPKQTDEILHKFYNEQKDSLYYQLHKVNAYAMLFSSRDEAEQIIQKINSGTPFEKVTGRYFVKTFIRERNGRIKYFQSEEEPYLGEDAFKLNLNEVAGPIEYVDAGKGRQYAVIKCVHIRPEKQLLFEDVKTTIADDYRNYQKEKRRKEVRDLLWKKYDVEVFEDVVEKKLSINN